MTTTTTTKPMHTSTPTPTPKGGIGFELILDRSSYEAAPGSDTLNATMILRCQPGSSTALTFITGQEFDLKICDSTGKQVALWSAGRAFPDLVRTIDVTGERKWVAAMPLPVLTGGELSANYTATAYLTRCAPSTPKVVDWVLAQLGEKFPFIGLWSQD